MDVVTEAAQFEGRHTSGAGRAPRGSLLWLSSTCTANSGSPFPRTSEEQAQVGAPVASLAAAQPGDLLFFAGWTAPRLAWAYRNLRWQRPDNRRAPYRHDGPGPGGTRQSARRDPTGVAGCNRNGRPFSPARRQAGHPNGECGRPAAYAGTIDKRQRRTEFLISPRGAPVPREQVRTRRGQLGRRGGHRRVHAGDTGGDGRSIRPIRPSRSRGGPVARQLHPAVRVLFRRPGRLRRRLVAVERYGGIRRMPRRRSACPLCSPSPVCPASPAR